MWRTSKLIIITLCFGLVLPMLIGLGVHFFFRPQPPKQPVLISEIAEYAKDLPELRQADDHNWEDPHFERYYETRNPRPWQLILRALHLWPEPIHSPKYLSQLLQKVTNMNKLRGLVDGKQSFIHIKSLEPTTLFVFGDVHGAFHSLIRALQYFKAQGIMSDDLQILTPNTYIIFNGDLINRSPFDIDTLILALQLLKKNPEHVFYLAGNHERNGRWLDYSLSRELTIRGRYYSSEPIPFRNSVMSFFETLPEAIYVSGKDEQNEVIRISFNERNDLRYDEKSLNTSFIKQQQNVQIYSVSELEKSKERLDVRAVIKTEDWRRHNRIQNGLGLLDQFQGAINWAVLSSPTMVHRVFLKFYDDAFITIKLHHLVRGATLALTHQDTRLMNGYKMEPARNVISARSAEQEIAPTDIKVASTVSLVRGQPNLGKKMKLGIDARMTEYNLEKGPQESNIRYYIDNDDYVPKLARQNTIQHLEKGIRLFLLSNGMANILSYMELIEKTQSAVFFPIAGSEQLRNPEFSRVIHFRATYEDEARVLVRVLKKDHGAVKFAIFYQDDAYGLGPFKAAISELNRMGIKNIMPLPYTRGSITFHAQAEKLLRDPPDALGFFSTASATKELIRQVGVGELITPKMFGLGIIGEMPLIKFIEGRGLSILLGSPVPNPHTSQIEIARKFRKIMDAEQSLYDAFSFESYIGTSIFLETIAKLKNQVPTANEVLKAIESIRNMNFHGMELNFNPKTRSLGRYVWIQTGENSEWEQYPVDQ